LRRIAELYAIEGSIRGRTAEARRHGRNTSARPLIEMMKPWLEIELGRVPPAGPLAEAIRYALARWPALTRFLDDGRIELDNNPVERAIGPSRSGARTIYSRARTVAASDGQPSAPSSPPQSSTTSSPLPGSETSAAHDRRSSRQSPRRTLAVELATNKPQGLSNVQGMDAYAKVAQK
jgi:hypothetical protein